MKRKFVDGVRYPSDPSIAKRIERNYDRAVISAKMVYAIEKDHCEFCDPDNCDIYGLANGAFEHLNPNKKTKNVDPTLN